MISLCQPCFQFKTILAYKGHSGFNGFIAPFFTKYLHRREVWTQTITGAGASVQSFTAEYQADRLTGDVTQTVVSPIGFMPFPFSATPPDSSTPGWVVQDAYFSHTQTGPIDFGTVTIKQEVFLSQQYTLAALDGDTDALINSVNPDSFAYGQVFPVSYDNFGGVSTDNATFNLVAYGRTIFNPSLSPPQQRFFPNAFVAPGPLWVYNDNPSASYKLNSVCGYVYLPNGLPTAENGFDVPCGYAKWASWVKLAGKYALRTTWFNALVPGGADVRIDCLPGLGSCAKPGILIKPPPVTPTIGLNAYSLITPGGDCP